MTKITFAKKVRGIKILSPVIHLSQMTAGRLEAWGKLELQKLIRTWIAPFESIKRHYQDLYSSSIDNLGTFAKKIL